MTTWWRALIGLFRQAARPSVDVQSLAVRHLIRGHQGEALLCEGCRNA